MWTNSIYAVCPSSPSIVARSFVTLIEKRRKQLFASLMVVFLPKYASLFTTMSSSDGLGTLYIYRQSHSSIFRFFLFCCRRAFLSCVSVLISRWFNLIKCNEVLVSELQNSPMTGKQTRDEPEKGKGAVLHAEANVNHLVRPVLKEKTNIVLKVKKNHEKPGDWALANPMSNSDEEDEVEVRGQVTRKLNKFIASAAPEMKFSQKMTSFKRRIAHEVAEEAGLWHQSEKKGKKRRLVVRKRVDAGTQGRRNDHAEGDEGLRDQAEVDGGRHMSLKGESWESRIPGTEEYCQALF